MDTRLGESGINKIKQRFNLFGVCVPSIGKSGGLALLWTKESIVDLQSFSKHHIDAKVTNVGSNEVWRITGFYGEADANKRKHTWALLKRLAQMSDTPWVVIGDYNEVTTQSDKQGGTVIPNWRLQDIREAMIFCGLQEIDYEGFQFTWSNHQEDNQHTQSRLNWASATSDWLLLFPTVIVSHLFTYNSDHMPILLILKVVQNRRYNQNKKRFRFEAMWLKAEDCDKIVKENWDMNSCLTTNLEGCRLGLMNWEKYTFGSVKKQIREMKLELKKIQKAQQTAKVVQRRKVLKAKLELVMDREESMWRQRAKTQWMFEGDRNTKFFHSHASRRAKINGIDSLTGEDENVCTDERIMGQMVNSYFSTIFKSRRPTEAEIDDVVGIMGPRVSQQINQELNRVFTPDEHDDFMLREFVNRWANNKVMVRWLSGFFQYLDRDLTVQKESLLPLKEVGHACFQDLVYHELNVKVRDAVISLIDQEHEGEQIDRVLLKNVLDIFVEIGMGHMFYYDNDFEAALLQDTVAYYSRKASNWILEDSCPDYMLKAEECLRREKDRVSHYLHFSSEPKLLERVQHELLSVNATQLLGKEHSGCHALLRDDKVRRDEHGSTSGLSNTDLNWIWRLQLPNKIKIFLWRIIKQSLPVAVALSKREIDIDLMCPVCQLAEETCLHIFKDCSYARLYWAMLNLPYNIITFNAENICHWFQHVRMKLGEKEFEFFITSCWSLWSNRNKKVHESSGYDAQESVQFVQHFILMYREAQDLYSNPRPPECEQP